MIFNTDLVKMKVIVANAENILRKAMKTLKAKIPKVKDCDYCSYKESLS